MIDKSCCLVYESEEGEVGKLWPCCSERRWYTGQSCRTKLESSDRVLSYMWQKQQNSLMD